MTTAAPAEQSRIESILQFLATLRANCAFEDTRPLIRVTPHGIFASNLALDRLCAEFQSWLLKISQGAADKTLDKTKQWLLQTNTPEKLYLVEGKALLTGVLIPLPIKNPQSLGLPFYLGSLPPAGDYLHPLDPELRKITGITVSRGQSGVEVTIKRREGTVKISEAVLKSFRRLAASSPFLKHRYPGSDRELLVALTGLVSLLKRARIAPQRYPTIVPNQIINSKQNRIRVAGKFLFIENNRGEVTRIIEAHGRNLSDFLREELRSATREKLGSFRLTPKARDTLGYYQLASNKHAAIHPRAFSEFVQAVRLARDPRERFNGWFNASDCFERFASIYQLAQPIERNRIAQTLIQYGLDGHSFKINQGWIFALSVDGTVMRCIGKHIRERKGRGRKASTPSR
jgi:hypothetical protein